MTTAISLAQLAARWSCTTQTLRNMVRRGDLVAFQVGRLMRVSLEEVEKREQGRMPVVSPEPVARGKRPG